MKIEKSHFRALFWLYFASLVLISIAPLNTSGELNDMTVVAIRGDYFLHAIVFLPWTALVFFAFRLNLSWVMIGLVLAAATEVVQYFLHYRAFNINDLIANMAGVVIGLATFVLLAKIIKPGLPVWNVR